MEIEIELLGFEQYVKKTSGYNTLPWFSLSNDTLLHPDFFNVTAEEFKVFIWICSVATKVKSSVIRLHLDHTCRTIATKKDYILSCIEKLEGKRVHMIERPSSGLDPAFNGPLRTNITNEHNERTHMLNSEKLSASEFDQFYFKYPKKVGKQKGMKTFKTQIRTPEDLEKVNTALNNYIAHVQKNVKDATYIKQFDTFMNCWREWLDPENGKVNFTPAASKRLGTDRVGVDWDKELFGNQLT